MLPITANLKTIAKFSLGLGSAMAFHALMLTGANANPEMDSCGRDITSGPLTLLCHDGMLVDPLSTQSISQTDSGQASQEEQVPGHRFRYEEF